MAMTTPQILSRAHDSVYEGNENPAMPEMWLKDDKSLPVVTVNYTPELSCHSDEEKQITYLNLPKIALRLRTLTSDLNQLGCQFFDTLAILEHLIYRRLFGRKLPTQAQHQLDYRVVHLHTDPQLNLEDVSESLMLGTEKAKGAVLLIFPVAAGTWELLIDALYLEKLLISNHSEFPLVFTEPSGLPKGIVGRIAQIRSVARFEDRWVWWAHLGVLEQFPWNHIMKDTAESMSIYQSDYAIIGSQMYEL
ncbi:MAG: hypothetical protein Q9215_000211 [Flavoplaca cf. flavocitrina]